MENILIRPAYCEKCDIEMKIIEVEFKYLPFEIQKLLVQTQSSYQVWNCPKCNSNGIRMHSLL